MRVIQLPPAELFRGLCKDLEAALKQESQKDVRSIANAIAREFCTSLDIPVPKVTVLGARPLAVTETTQMELFGDYHPEDMKIRLWMRTAVQKKATSFGTFLSTLCHELCHHHDLTGLNLPNSYHTRGFYARAGLLYHHMRGTPVRALAWDALRSGQYRINWPRTMSGRG